MDKKAFMECVKSAAKKRIDIKFYKGQILDSKAAFMDIKKYGECQYVDVMFEVDAPGVDGKTEKTPVSMPMDLYYNGQGKLTSVKLYWDSLPAFMLKDFADFLKTLNS